MSTTKKTVIKAKDQNIADKKNVLGTPLQSCCHAPKTGYFRDGYCRTDETDRGRHVICAQMTAAFLSFTRKKGNDLSTPQPAYDFPGLKPGDRWCLCGNGCPVCRQYITRRR